MWTGQGSVVERGVPSAFNSEMRDRRKAELEALDQGAFKLLQRENILEFRDTRGVADAGVPGTPRATRASSELRPFDLSRRGRTVGAQSRR